MTLEKLADLAYLAMLIFFLVALFVTESELSLIMALYCGAMLEIRKSRRITIIIAKEKGNDDESND